MAAARFAGAVRQFSTSSAVRAKLASAPIQVFGIEGRYAHALYSAASKEKKLDAVEKELKSIETFIKSTPQVAEFIANPSIKRTEKKTAIVQILEKQKVSPITLNLFTLLAENGRFNKMNGVIAAFAKIMSAHRGEVVCTVTTAKPLDAKNLKDLETTLKTFFKKGETLQLVTKVDPALIGGMVVDIGDKYIDMSMATKIKTYTNLIKQAV